MTLSPVIGQDGWLTGREGVDLAQNRAFYSDPASNAGLPMPVDGGFLA